MYKPFSLFVGLRYTRSRRRRKFISFSSLMSILGIGLGVFLLIVVLSVMNGFEREMQARLLSVLPHATVHKMGYQALTKEIPLSVLPRNTADLFEKPFFEWQMQVDKLSWQELSDKLLEYQEIEATAPFIETEVMLARGGRMSGVYVNGIEPNEHKKVSIIANDMIEGDFTDLKSKSFNIIVGKSIANSLGLFVGDKVTMVLPEATMSPAGVFPRLKRFTVAGIFDSKSYEVNSRLVFVHIADAAKLLRLEEYAQGLRLKLNDLFMAPDVSYQIEKDFSNIRSRNWTHTHGTLFKAIKFEKLLIGILLFFVIIVALFNVLSTLMMIVNEKRSDIAIMRTYGASSGSIVKIFMVQGLLIGFAGVFWGAVLGLIAAFNVPKIIGWIENAFDTVLLDPTVYFINYIPSDVRISTVAIICGVALLISFLFTIYPAIRASKVEPAEALRYE